MTNYRQFILGTQAGSNPPEIQKPSVCAALRRKIFWERIWERKIKNLGFLRVLRSQGKLLTGNLPKKINPKNGGEVAHSKALAVFAAFPLPKTHYQSKPLILLDSYVPKIPIYYIYRWVLANTPYKYNLGLGLVGFFFVGGTS